MVSFALIALASLSAFGGTDSKVIAVVNHAEWCSVCKNNGERAQTVFMENNSDGAIRFIVNDLTSDETKSKSELELKDAGVAGAMAGYKGTGLVYFFNAETKELITKVSVSKSNEELAGALATARTGA